MSSPPPLDSLSRIVLGLFPWLARCGVSEATTRLEVRSDGAGLEIEGGGAAVGRVGDLVVRLYRDSVAGVLYVSTSATAPYVWAPVASGIIPPTIADAGTACNISAGSAKVTCG